MNSLSIEMWALNLLNFVDSSVIFNTAAVFGISVVATTIIMLSLRLLNRRLSAIVQKTSSIWDDVAVELLHDVRGWVVFFSILYVMTKTTDLFPPIHRALMFIVVLAVSFQTAIWGLHLIKAWRENILDKRIEQDPSSAAAIGLFYTAVRAAFLVLIALIGLSNMGIDVSAVLAGLGLGGIAVALAAQNILGDLLASLSIVLDKPFVVGDYVVSGDLKGTVEFIGIKTTRLRSLTGEQVVVSNKSLLESQIRNFKRMSQRRAVQRFGVVYSTPADKLPLISVWVKELVQKYDKLVFDRCHFIGYGDSSLDFELVFFVTDTEYNVYMDIQQNLLIDIFKKLTDEKIDFAFPTRTVQVQSLPLEVQAPARNGVVL